MRWFLRGLCLAILLLGITAVFAPGLVGSVRNQVPGLDRSIAQNATDDDSQPIDTESQSNLELNPTDTLESDPSGINMSPLFGGLARLSGQLSDATGQEELQLDNTLAAADRQLSQVKQENQSALREVARPYRRVAPGTPHILLITVSGLRHEDVLNQLAQSQQATSQQATSQQSTLATMHQEGLRFSQYYSRRSRDLAWRELQSGLLTPDWNDRNQSLMGQVWKSGYLTALIGDGTRAPEFQGPHDPHYDFRFSVEDEALSDRKDVSQFLSNGQPIEVVLEGQDLETQDYFLNQAASYLAAHRRGRPTFIHLTLDVSTDTDHAAQVARLDHRLKLFMDFVKAQSLQRELVMILASVGTRHQGDTPATQAAAERAPLLMYWPDRKISQTTDYLCSTCDLLPTIAHWTRAPQIEGCDGISLKPSALNQRQDRSRVLVWYKTNREEQTVVAQAPWELILSNPHRLYDSLRDPQHEHELSEEIPSVTEQLIGHVGVQL